MPKQYTTHKYPCLDVYPAGEEFIPPSQLKKMAQQQLKKQGLRGKLSVGKEMRKLKAAFKVSAIWDQPELNITFVDGSPKQKNWVKSVIKKDLEPIVNGITFNWDAPVERSDIRISFQLQGQAWSTVGTDAKKVPSPQPTMNLGWLDDDTQYGSEAFKNTGQVVLHEFGHAMGMIHEHQNPKDNQIVWNKPVVIAELAESQGWDMNTINVNMFAKYGDKELCEDAKALPSSDSTRAQKIEDYCSGELVNGSAYDVNSIMHYFYPAEWIKEGPKKIPVNTTFSELDRKWLHKYYGKGELPAPSPDGFRRKRRRTTVESNRNIITEQKVEEAVEEEVDIVDRQFVKRIILTGIVLCMFALLIYFTYTTVYPNKN